MHQQSTLVGGAGERPNLVCRIQCPSRIAGAIPAPLSLAKFISSLFSNQSDGGGPEMRSPGMNSAFANSAFAEMRCAAGAPMFPWAWGL
jgi:hypothetical protein